MYVYVHMYMYIIFCVNKLLKTSNNMPNPQVEERMEQRIKYNIYLYSLCCGS